MFNVSFIFFRSTTGKEISGSGLKQRRFDFEEALKKNKQGIYLNFSGFITVLFFN